MKLIQIFGLAAALVANAVAQTSSQNTGSADPSTAKPQPQHQTSTSTDSQKKDSAKSNTASKKTTGASSQTGGIKVIVPSKGGNQATSSGKNASATPAGGAKASVGAKPASQPASSKTAVPMTGGSTTAAKKTTGAGAASGKSMQPAAGAASSKGTAQGNKTPVSGSASSHPATGQKKQTPPVLAVSPSSKQAATKKGASTAKGATKGATVASKIAQPRIVQKKPSKADLVVAAKTSAKISSAGRRDPFVSPIRTVTPNVPSGPNCSTGKRCLAINELTVQGTAKDTDGKMMAIVASSTHRAYFLRENDQVFNGSVQKITSDSVIFRESVTDSLGRQSTHEIVKKVNPS